MKKQFFYFLSIVLFTFIACQDSDDAVQVNLDYPFDVALNYQNTGILENSSIVKATVTNEFDYDAPSNLSFKLSFTSSKEGYFIVNDEQYQSGIDIPINVGINSLQYVPLQSGNHTINLVFINSKGYEVEKSISINYDEAQFDFTVNGQDLPMYFNYENPISLYVDNLNSPQSMQYEYKYIILTGAAYLYHQNQSVSENVYKSIPHGESFQLSLKPTNIAPLKIMFTVKNQFGVKIEKTLTWNVLSPDFNFSVNIQDPSIYADVPFESNVLIQGEQNMGYVLQWAESDLHGNFIDQNIQTYTFLPTQTGMNVTYKFINNGQYNDRYVTYKLTNQFNQTKTVTKMILVKDARPKVQNFTKTINSSTAILSIKNITVAKSPIQSQLDISKVNVFFDSELVHEANCVSNDCLTDVQLPMTIEQFFGTENIGVQVLDSNGFKSEIKYKAHP